MHTFTAGDPAATRTRSAPLRLLAAPPETVLVGDGDEDIHAIYGALLEYRGYVVIHARSAAECLRLVRSRPVSAVVVSVGSHGLFGWKSCHRLTSAARDGGFTLVCLTTDPHLSPGPRRHLPYAAAVLMLPCPPETVAAEIERAVARPPPSSTLN